MMSEAFVDNYKILNVPLGASEAEIKKRYRVLAKIHHPDKNGGSEKSEEIFKVILNAYEILSNKDKRVLYDIKYRQHFQNQKSETTNKNNTYTRQEAPKQQHWQHSNSERNKTQNTKRKVSFWFWIVFILIAIIYLYNSTTTTTGNAKADQQLEEQDAGGRPQTGEIIFTTE